MKKLDINKINKKNPKVITTKETLKNVVPFVKLMESRDKILNDLTTYMNKIERENELLKQEFDSYNKDKEIQKLKKEIDYIRKNSIKIMTNKEKSALEQFRKDHYKTCKSSTKLILTPTGIGTDIEIVCNECGKIKDITDIDSW